jgi:hypothetical protein
VAARNDHLLLFHPARGGGALMTTGVDLRAPASPVLGPTHLFSHVESIEIVYPWVTTDGHVRAVCGPSRGDKHTWMVEAPFEAHFPKQAR